MRTRRTLLPAFLAAVALALAGAAPAASAAPFPYCSWWVKTTPQSANVAFPDAAATYWTTPFLASPGTSFEVQGAYPDARYMSFNVYDSSFGTFPDPDPTSGKADYLIDPLSGSVNPFRQPARAGGGFLVTVSNDAPAGTPNVLPLAPDGEDPGRLGAPLGYLTFRVYLPTGGDGTVALPSLTLVQDGVRTPLAPCGQATRAAVAGGTPATVLRKLGATAAPGEPLRTRIASARLRRATATAPLGTTPCRGRGCPAPLRFFRPKSSTTNAFFPNVDNAYVAMLVRPRPGEVVVIRGKAPTRPRGTHPLPWGQPTPRYDLRYWSLCANLYHKPWPVVANRLPGGRVEYGCSADLDTRLDARGRYTFVLGPQSAARAIRRQPGATFLPISSREPRARHMLALRNMLGADFPHSVQQVAQDGEPRSAARTMGAYYPRAHRCTLQGFLRDGADCALPR